MKIQPTPARPPERGSGIAGKWAWVTGFAVGAALMASLVPGRPVGAQEQPQVVDLTLDRMVDLTLSRSYQIRRLNLEIQRDQHNLHAEQARLKSSVDMELTMPAYRRTSEPKWNSDLQKNEIIQEHTRTWEGELSVSQPVILFGYPTNGYLSLNNRMYKYIQVEDDGSKDVTFYNRYYISYRQPLLQPNELKNDLEQAEMRLEETQLDFYSDVVRMVNRVSRTYYDLFREHYSRSVSLDLVNNLERALAMAEDLAEADSTRAIDIDQIRVELANARENVQSAESSIRLRSAGVKRDLGFSDADSIAITPTFQIDPVPIDMNQAIQYARDLTPRMRNLAMDLRNSEIRLEDTKGRGGFQMNLNMSYGRERRDEEWDKLWVDPDNSYTVNVTADIPLWDWGERKARLASSRIGIEQTLLRIEEQELEMVSDVRNEVLNVRDRESRTLAMRDNLELAREVTETSFQRYRDGAISVLDLLLSLRREEDTAENFVDAYLSWKSSLRSLQEQTYFDFELGIPVLERYGVQNRMPQDGVLGLRPVTPGEGR